MHITRILVWAVVLAPACKCHDNVRPPTATLPALPAATQLDAAPAMRAADAAATVDGNRSDAAPMLRATPLQPSDNEALAALPSFTGATIVQPGRRLFNDTQWFAVSCGPLAGTFELLRTALQSQGWSEESKRSSADIQAVTAQRAGLQVSIIVERSRRADCSGATASFTGFRLQR